MRKATKQKGKKKAFSLYKYFGHMYCLMCIKLKLCEAMPSVEEYNYDEERLTRCEVYEIYNISNCGTTWTQAGKDGAIKFLLVNF